MKIVVLDGYALNPGDLSWDKLKTLGEVTIYDRTNANEIVDRIKGYDAVIVNKTPLNKEAINSTDTLQYIGILATGYNIIDIEAANAKKIPVVNVPGYSTDSVAQMTFALILEIVNQVGLHSNLVHQGKWIKSKDFCFCETPLSELKDKTLGIIGYGAIGQAVGRIAKAFNMKLLVNAKHPKPELENENTKYVDYDTIFANSDIITLHTPLFDETMNLIRENNIAKMKDGVIIINTARGPIVNETDMLSALESGKVRGYGCDVISTEPMRKDCPLYKAPNTFITPHIAWAPIETRIRLMDIVYNNLKSFVDGKPVNVVNNISI